MKVAKLIVLSAVTNLLFTLVAMAVAPYVVVPGVQLPVFQELSWIPKLPSTSLVLYYQLAAASATLSAVGISFAAWQSLMKSRVNQDLTFFIDVTVRSEHVRTISGEMRSRATQRQNHLAAQAAEATTSEKMQEVTELAAEITTQLQRAEHYEAIARRLGKLQLATI